MADFTSTGWRAGETVSAYAYSPTPPGGATGSVLDSDTASSSGEVTFTGLDTGEEYVAVGGTSARRIRFRVPLPESAQSSSATLVGFCEWSTDTWTFAGEAIDARPAYAGKLFWLGGGAGADPTPAGLDYATQGDIWVPSEAVT